MCNRRKDRLLYSVLRSSRFKSVVIKYKLLDILKERLQKQYTY